VIVITGPGRSGTSFLARLYQELGFSPIVGGGGWDDAIQGGLEDIEIGTLNGRLIADLGMRSKVWRLASATRRLGLGTTSRESSGVAGKNAPRRQAAVDAPLIKRAATQFAAKTFGRHIRQQRWARIPAVVERHGAQMRSLAASRVVVKDPGFCQTLRLWVLAGAEIDHVIVSIRSVDATVAGLLRLGALPGWSRGVAENEVAYRLGLLLAAIWDHRLSHSVIRFPDYLEERESLYDALRFPEPVNRDRFRSVFESLRRPELVSSWK